MPHRALVMSGGGSKGAFQVGALDHLIGERGLDFDVVAGVSTGSLNAVILAQGNGAGGLKAQLETLKGLWFGIKSERDIYTKRFLGDVLVFLSKESVNDPGPLRAKLDRHLDLGRLKTSGKQLRVGATSLESGEYVAVSQESARIREWTLASASIPLLFPPVRIGSESAADGGVRNVTPLQDAFDALRKLPASEDPGEDEIYVLLASPLETLPAAGPWKNGRQIGGRSLSLFMNEIFREDLEYALAINEAVRFFEALQAEIAPSMPSASWERFLDAHPFRYRPPKYRHVGIHAVVPDREFSDALEFNPRKIREAFDAGRAAARRVLDGDALADRLASTAPRREEPPAETIAARLRLLARPALPKEPEKRPAA